jgi:predicted  nucleic acid-binding Zn-ribbon protein
MALIKIKQIDGLGAIHTATTASIDSLELIVATGTGALDASVDSLEGNVSDLQAADLDLQDSVDSLEGNVSDLQGADSDLQDSVDSLEDNVSDLQAADSDLEASVDSLEGNVSDLQAADSDLQDSVDSLEGNVSDLQAADSDLQDSVDSLEVVDSGLNTRLTTAEGDIDALEASVDSLEVVDSGLNTRLTTAEGDIDALEASVNSLESAANTVVGFLEVSGATTARGDVYSFAAPIDLAVEQGIYAVSINGVIVHQTDGAQGSIVAAPVFGYTVAGGQIHIAAEFALDNNDLIFVTYSKFV